MLLLIIMISLQCHNGNVRSSYRKEHSEVILDAFWRPCGRTFRPFWGHVEVKNRLGGSLSVRLRLQVDFPGSTPPILEGFGELLERILEIFWYLFLI